MAGHAADALGDMDIVAEIDVFRQAGNAMPDQCLVAGETLTNRREHRRAGPYLRVAGHTSVRRREPRARAVGDIGVAVAAIDAETADMMFVAEGDGLRARVDVGARIETGACESDRRSQSAGDEHDTARQ